MEGVQDTTRVCNAPEAHERQVAGLTRELIVHKTYTRDWRHSTQHRCDRLRTAAHRDIEVDEAGPRQKVRKGWTSNQHWR